MLVQLAGITTQLQCEQAPTVPPVIAHRQTAPARRAPRLPRPCSCWLPCPVGLRHACCRTMRWWTSLSLARCSRVLTRMPASLYSGSGDGERAPGGRSSPSFPACASASFCVTCSMEAWGTMHACSALGKRPCAGPTLTALHGRTSVLCTWSLLKHGHHANRAAALRALLAALTCAMPWLAPAPHHGKLLLEVQRLRVYVNQVSQVGR